jgi:hypothetical protein
LSIFEGDPELNLGLRGAGISRMMRENAAEKWTADVRQPNVVSSTGAAATGWALACR